MQYILILLFLLFLTLYSNLIGKIFEKFKLPSLIGMMLAGMLIGPFVFDKTPQTVLTLAPSLKDIALVIILFIGGLEIGVDQIKKIGRPAILLCVIPVTLEGFTVALLSTIFLHFTFLQGLILGFIIAAVSPGILIPSMVNLINKNIGQKKDIPQMLLVGASGDNTVSITLFASFLTIYSQEIHGGSFNFNLQLLSIVVSTCLSIILGWIIAKIGEYTYLKINKIHLKIGLLFIICLTLRWIEILYHVPLFNSLLTIMALGFFIRFYQPDSYKHINGGMNVLWKYVKVYLFTFVGMAINPKLVGGYFYTGIVILACSLFVRSIGVLISLIGVDLTLKERLFCVIAYLPKATVQSAKAGIPLQMGVAGGEIMQALSILSILVTAPLGVIGINMTYKKFLKDS